MQVHGHTGHLPLRVLFLQTLIIHLILWIFRWIAWETGLIRYGCAGQLRIAPFLARNLSEEDDLAIYFDCGIQDEFLTYAFNTSFADSLDRLGIPYEFQSFTGGHSNQLSTRFPIALQFLDSVMYHAQ